MYTYITACTVRVFYVRYVQYPFFVYRTVHFSCNVVRPPSPIGSKIVHYCTFCTFVLRGHVFFPSCLTCVSAQIDATKVKQGATEPLAKVRGRCVCFRLCFVHSHLHLPPLTPLMHAHSSLTLLSLCVCSPPGAEVPRRMAKVPLRPQQRRVRQLLAKRRGRANNSGM
jgi:hypothetical protein